MAQNFYRRKLIEYIKRNLKKGYPLETLRVALINQNYSRPTIDEAIKESVKEMALEAPVLKEKPKIEHEIIMDEIPYKKESFFRRILNFFK
jgi:hypothetical protein